MLQLLSNKKGLEVSNEKNKEIQEEIDTLKVENHNLKNKVDEIETQKSAYYWEIERLNKLIIAINFDRYGII